VTITAEPVLADLVDTAEQTPAPTTASGIVLSPQQQQAAQTVLDWFSAGQQQVCRVFGYAGTGKTTLAKHIIDSLGINARYAAYTTDT